MKRLATGRLLMVTLVVLWMRKRLHLPIARLRFKSLRAYQSLQFMRQARYKMLPCINVTVLVHTSGQTD